MKCKNKFTKEEVLQARKYYGFDCFTIIDMPEIWTRCEICGQPLMYHTSVYCMNNCKSIRMKDYCDGGGEKYEVRFCCDCLEKINNCPICGKDDFGR